MTAVFPWLIICTLRGLYLIGPGFPNACYHSVGTSPLLVYSYIGFRDLFHTPLSSVTAVSPWLITCTLRGLYLIGPGFPNACYHLVGTSPLLVYCLLLHWLSRPISYPPVICDSSIPLVDYLHPPGSIPNWTRFSKRMLPLGRHLSPVSLLFTLTLAFATYFIPRCHL